MTLKERIHFDGDFSWGLYPKRVLGEFKVTAYSLEISCCGKPKGHYAYGLTASGYSVKNKNRYQARTVAVDPSIIPIGSFLFLEFKGAKADYSGFYIARDTGSAIKGRKLDIFLGDGSYSECVRFGVSKVIVHLINL